MNYRLHSGEGSVKSETGGEVDLNISDIGQVAGEPAASGGGDHFVPETGQLTHQSPSEGAGSAGDQDPQVCTTVRLCSRMYWRRYQGPPPPVPEVPEPFQPPKLCTSGQAPVVAPARRFT